MRDERFHRRPRFRPGEPLKLADGQAWSVPAPGKPGGPRPAWDDETYRAILRAATEAANEGELFHAEVALAIHLLDWNYSLDPGDYEELLEDRGGARPWADVAGELRRLAMAHAAHHAAGDPRHAPASRAGEFFRMINIAAWRALGRGGPRESGESADLTA